MREPLATDPLVCVYDANVLYPAQLRDLLIRLAVEGLVRARWTSRIHAEWTRNVLANHPDITREQLRRTRRLMERALPAAEVRGYEHRAGGLALPDPNDRHVLAAALEVGAEAIITFNLRDFPAKSLKPHGIEAVHPDQLAMTLLDERPDAVLGVMRRHRTSLRKPPKSPEEYLQILRRARLEETAQMVAKSADRL